MNEVAQALWTTKKKCGGICNTMEENCKNTISKEKG